MKRAANIMFLGTGSDVGKSVTTTAFCRILKNRGYRVAPFKAQNMSNNSYVTLEGGEIGRSSAVQAEACGIAPCVHMNPILLKPTGQMGSQVIIQGNVYGNMSAKDYYNFKPVVREKIMESYAALATELALYSSSVIVMEGAGSCCEVNLRDSDIVNFEMASAVDAPVILVADIDRGGVFAQIIGTLETISSEEQNRIAGFIINKFRGDSDLFQDGIKYIENRTEKPVFGLVPMFKDFKIDSEDSMSLDLKIKEDKIRPDRINIAVIRLPHISNFTDIEALEYEPDVAVFWLNNPQSLEVFDAVILPGTKSTIQDMIWIKQSGWIEPIKQFSQKKPVIGLCGGFQILGKQISDPHNIEGMTKQIPGIGLLDVVTEIEPTKIVRRSEGKDALFGSTVCGYEIHMGKTRLYGSSRPFLDLTNGHDGSINIEVNKPNSGNIFGTYLHGLFDSGAFRGNFIKWIAQKKGMTINMPVMRKDYWEEKNQNYDRLAAHFSANTDVDRIIKEVIKGDLRF